MKKIVLALSMLLACSAANASMFGSADVVKLGGGEVAPRQTLELKVSALIPYVSYRITCDITDPKNAVNPVVMAFMVLSGTSPGTIFLNGVRLGYPSQSKLTKINNTFLLEGYSQEGHDSYRSPAITFINADDNDSVTVSNCVAKVQD